jgi:hypothetical protein
MIKPIETKYKGYRFRSRLEARWAVFFDAIGIKWEYEKEGYELDGIKYLPDFWLPEYCRWAEVKPVDFTVDEQEKAFRLQMTTGHDVIMLVGLPAPKVYTSIRGNGYGMIPYKEWLFDTSKINLDYHHLPFSEWPQSYRAQWEDLSVFVDLDEACDAARSARFEHGERP